MHKLFVVGFSREMDEMQLTELFTFHGLVKTVTIIRDQQSGISKGYGFVEMMDQAGAERAIQAIDGLVIESRTISARYANRNPVDENLSRPLSKRTFPTTDDKKRSNYFPKSPGQRPKRPRK